jgi:hypothetical protein
MFDIEKQRRSKRLKAFLDQRFKQVGKVRGIPLDEVERRLGLRPYRNKKRRSSRNGAKQN